MLLLLLLLVWPRFLLLLLPRLRHAVEVHLFQQRRAPAVGLAPHARAYSAGPEVGEESEDGGEDDDEDCFIFIFFWITPEWEGVGC